MKLKFWTFQITAAAALVALEAQAQNSGFYLKADAGGQWTLDSTLKEFYGEPLAPNSKVSFDPGLRLGMTAGYMITDWFGLEAQTGVMANKITSVTGASRLDDASFANVPLLLNARFECPGQCRVTPYLGGGLGGSLSTFSADHLDIGSTSMHGSQSTAVFAYQAFGGIRVRITDRIGVSAEYRYFATTGPDWEADHTNGTITDHLRFGGAQTHTVSLAFDFRF